MSQITGYGTTKGIYRASTPTLVDNQEANLALDASGNLLVNVAVGGGGGSGTQYAELTTTSPATGTLALGRYQTAFPTLTNGQMNEPMLDSSSRLLVNGSGVTQPVSSASATGSSVPANAFYIAGVNSSGNLAGLVTYDRANDSASGTGILSIGNYIYNGTNDDRIRSVVNGTNSIGTGIVASGLIAQLDDVSPTVITENQFGSLRIDSARQLRVNNQLAPDATALNTYSVHLTANATTTPTAATAYVSSITLSNEVGGTTSSITIQDKQGTPLKLVNGVATTALTTVPTVINFQTPVKMVSGIDIITAGAVAATVDVWINYYQ